MAGCKYTSAEAQVQIEDHYGIRAAFCEAGQNGAEEVVLRLLAAPNRGPEV